MTTDREPEPFAELPSIETPRLVLRRVRLDDAADMFEAASDPRMSQHTSWAPHRSISDSETFIQDAIERYARGQIAPWGVERRTDGRFIGTCGYVNWWRHDHCGELGYALGRRYWGQGLMTEAAGAVIRFGFEEMALHRVQARCEIDNVGSARVMEKCAMRYEGTMREVMYNKGRFVDLKFYGILRSEWEVAAGKDLPRLEPTRSS